MTHGNLYSGIGGWLLAARWARIDNIFTVENDKFCNKVLDKHFPETDRYGNIKEFSGEKYKGTIDIISTSDPCQPFSFAGKRGGKEDDRYLWPQTIRVIQEIRPSYVVFENVPGFINMAFETVSSDLEAEGYTVESFIIPACAVGAWHRRDRLWVIAYTMRDGLEREVQFLGNIKESNFEPPNKNDSLLFKGWAEIYENTGELRANDGVSDWMDRLKSLGNSIVPQIAYIIFEAIKEYDK